VRCFSPIAIQFAHAEDVFVVTWRFFPCCLAEMRWETAPFLRDGRKWTERIEDIRRVGPDFHL